MKTKIKCSYTERQAVDKIIDLIEKYQHINSWEIGITMDGEIDAITDDSTRPYGSPSIAVRYFYTTTDDPIDCADRDFYLEYFMYDGAPDDEYYEIEFADGDNPDRRDETKTTMEINNSESNQHLLFTAADGGFFSVKCCVVCSYSYGKIIDNMHCRKHDLAIQGFWLCKNFTAKQNI